MENNDVMKPHNFVKDRPDVQENHPGYWHICHGCGFEIFHPDSHSDFVRRLTLAFRFNELVSILSKEELYARTVPGNFGMEKGYGGVLAGDCDEAQKFVIESTLIE